MTSLYSPDISEWHIYVGCMQMSTKFCSMNALTNVFFQISVMSKSTARRKIIAESTDRMAMVSIAVRPSVRLSLLSVEGCTTLTNLSKMYNNCTFNNRDTGLKLIDNQTQLHLPGSRVGEGLVVGSGLAMEYCSWLVLVHMTLGVFTLGVFTLVV